MPMTSSNIWVMAGYSSMQSALDQDSQGSQSDTLTAWVSALNKCTRSSTALEEVFWNQKVTLESLNTTDVKTYFSGVVFPYLFFFFTSELLFIRVLNTHIPTNGFMQQRIEIKDSAHMDISCSSPGALNSRTSQRTAAMWQFGKLKA